MTLNGRAKIILNILSSSISYSIVVAYFARSPTTVQTLSEKLKVDIENEWEVVGGRQKVSRQSFVERLSRRVKRPAPCKRCVTCFGACLENFGRLPRVDL